jgi:hypothetical protein
MGIITLDRVINVDPTRPVINYPGGDNGVAGGGVIGGGAAVSYQTLLLTHAPILYWPLEDLSYPLNGIEQLGSLGGYDGGINTVGATAHVAGPPSLVGSFAGRVAGGTASFIDIDSGAGAGSAAPSTSASGTLIGWFKGNALSGNFISWANASGLSTFQLAAGNNGVIQFNMRRANGGATNRSECTSVASFSDSSWHMAAVTTDGTNPYVMYVDGVSVSVNNTQTGTGTTHDWWDDVTGGGLFTTLGARRIVVNSGSAPFAGDMAQISLHNIVLTAPQIAALYAANLP